VFKKLYSNAGSLFPTTSLVAGVPVASSFVFDWLLGGLDAVEYKSLVVGVVAGRPYIGTGIRVDIAVKGWNEMGRAGQTNIAAPILLHELGHVFADLASQGSGGTGLLDDTRNSERSAQNTQRILEKCGLIF
jgi:hypothetical protein